MSGRGQSADKHIERTTTYLLQCPASTVPEVMRVCKYSTNKSVNPAKQMAVRRAHKKAVDARIKPPPQCNQRVESWGINNVTDCSHHRQLGITPINTNDTWRYTADKVKT